MRRQKDDPYERPVTSGLPLFNKEFDLGRGPFRVAGDEKGGIVLDLFDPWGEGAKDTYRFTHANTGYRIALASVGKDEALALREEFLKLTDWSVADPRRLKSNKALGKAVWSLVAKAEESE